VQLGLRIMPLEFPKRRNKVDGISKKTEIDHNYFFSAFGALEKTGCRLIAHGELLTRFRRSGDKKRGVY